MRELLRALLEKRAALDEEAALKKKAALQEEAQQKQAALEKKLAQEKQTALEKKAAAEKKAAEEKQRDQEKKAAAQEKAEEEKQAAREKQAALPKPAPPVAPPATTDRAQRLNCIALVVGNGDYHPSLGRLENPVNDATDVAKALRLLGFTVWLRLDLGHVEMKATLVGFAGAARDAETAVVFFAGHGFQYGGINYLAPIDAPIIDDGSIANHVSLTR